ncbi:EexN family lipoprotein [Phenylobacterium sp.]|uniref:EexN family lipoprotein n=1 Tax=Phenylobacterium sp. TaxID=1871053 RepID=UPI003525FFEF
MRSGAIISALCVGLCACQQPARSATYFEAHPDEAERIAVACRAGAQRGDECLNAEAGLVEVKRQARMKMFRRGFEK